MPDELEELSYTILQPADLNTEDERALTPAAFKNCSFKYAPVTRDEVAILAKIVEQYVRQGVSTPAEVDKS